MQITVVSTFQREKNIVFGYLKDTNVFTKHVLAKRHGRTIDQLPLFEANLPSYSPISNRWKSPDVYQLDSVSTALCSTTVSPVLSSPVDAMKTSSMENIKFMLSQDLMTDEINKDDFELSGVVLPVMNGPEYLDSSLTRSNFLDLTAESGGYIGDINKNVEFFNIEGDPFGSQMSSCNSPDSDFIKTQQKSPPLINDTCLPTPVPGIDFNQFTETLASGEAPGSAVLLTHGISNDCDADDLDASFTSSVLDGNQFITDDIKGFEDFALPEDLQCLSPSPDFQASTLL